VCGIVWKLQVPPKIRIFIWKALHGLIPGMAILANRHIKVPAQCPICKMGAEDIMHLMFTCSRAKEVWTALGLNDFITHWSKLDRSGSVVLEEILRADLNLSPVLGSLSVKETVAVAAWYIWWQRREGVKGEKIASPFSSAFSIKALTMNFSLAEQGATPKAITWSKPPAHHYKLNIDACFFPNGSGSTAAIIRNDHGEMIGGGTWPLMNILSPAFAEAMALKNGMLLLENIGCSPVVVESDSMELITACNGVIELWSPYSAVLADCFQIARRIGRISFQHCPREANMTAHNQARLSFDSNFFCIWDNDPPPSVLSDVLNDVTVLNS
jgi:ribonuclease HI